MKKSLTVLGGLILILLLLFTGMRRFFYGGYSYYGNPMIRPGYYRGHMMGYSRYGDEYLHMDIASEEWKNYIKVREESLRIYSKYGLDIGKKQLELDAELLKEEPDWERVQRINDEIALLESKIKTEMLKRRYETFKEQ